MLRAGSSRRSKTKSPYARPARSTRSMPATDQARGPALATDQARATDPTLPTDQATTSSVQNIPQVPSSVPNACGMYSSPPAQMSTMPALEPQHSQPQGTSMSTVTSPLVAQHGTHINPLVSITSDLGANVLMSTQEKIWNNEYIDLAKLLHSDPAAENQQLLVLEDGQIKITNKSKDKKIASISEWTDAILIYAAIYLKRFPQHVQGIIKYISSIRLGASRSTTMGWRDYDIQFRLRRAKNHLINWENIDAELWLLYMGQGSVPERKPAYSLHQHKRCYDFNLKGSCLKRDCRFSHNCLKCGQNHPSITCSNIQTTHNTSMSKKVSHSVGQQGNANFHATRFPRPFRQ